jgi:hypothetical protein
MTNKAGGPGGEMTPPMDNVSVLRIRIPIIPQEEEEEDDYFYEYEQEYEQEYDPFDDLENHYACLDYFEALRRARQQIQPDPFYEHDMDDISPIYGLDYDTPTVGDSL